MDKTHPHAGAEYELFEQQDGSFGIEVSIPDSRPTRVTGFASRTAAVAWAAKHKADVAKGVPLRRNGFRLKSRPQPSS